MVVNVLQQDRGAAKTFFTHEVQFAMQHAQVIDIGALVLAHLSAPGQWVTPLKWHSASGSCMPIHPINVGDLDGDTAVKNFRPFHKVIRE